jgi:hypothetical protein
MTNAATALPEWVGAVISLGAAAVLLALRAWIVSPWRGNQGSKAPERRRSLSWPATIPSIEPVSPRGAAARASTGEMSRRQTRGPLVQLRLAERTLSAPPAGTGEASARGRLRRQHS